MAPRGASSACTGACSDRPFDEEDLAVVKGISGTVAAALRTYVRQANPWLGQPSAPGLVILDRSGRVMSANDDAMCWLHQLWPGAPDLPDGAAPLDLFDLRDEDHGVPTVLFALVSRARALAEGRERTPARLRLRDRRRRWVVLHASALTGPESRPGDTVALVIEAAKSAELAPSSSRRTC